MIDTVSRMNTKCSECGRCQQIQPEVDSLQCGECDGVLWLVDGIISWRDVVQGRV